MIGHTDPLFSTHSYPLSPIFNNPQSILDMIFTYWTTPFVDKILFTFSCFFFNLLSKILPIMKAKIIAKRPLVWVAVRSNPSHFHSWEPPGSGVQLTTIGKFYTSSTSFQTANLSDYGNYTFTETHCNKYNSEKTEKYINVDHRIFTTVYSNAKWVKDCVNY